MNGFVVDTNVAIAASSGTPQAGPKCVETCIDALEEARKGIVVVDFNGQILQEYTKNLGHAGQPRPGHGFVKWVHDNQAVETRCERVRLTASDSDPSSFNEFPNDSRLNSFDPSDRKFVAVALASRLNPEVLNAVDSDWWNHREALSENKVRVKFLCPEQFEVT